MKRDLRTVHNAAIRGWKKLHYTTGIDFYKRVSDGEIVSCCYRGAAAYGFDPKHPQGFIQRVDALLGNHRVRVINISDMAGSKKRALAQIERLFEAAS